MRIRGRVAETQLHQLHRGSVLVAERLLEHALDDRGAPRPVALEPMRVGQHLPTLEIVGVQQAEKFEQDGRPVGPLLAEIVAGRDQQPGNVVFSELLEHDVECPAQALMSALRELANASKSDCIASSRLRADCTMRAVSPDPPVCRAVSSSMSPNNLA